MKKAYDYEVRQVDAWADGDCWTYNETWNMFCFKTSAKDHKKAFLNALRRHGIRFNVKIRVDFDGTLYEAVNAKTNEPIVVAIPCF